MSSPTLVENIDLTYIIFRALESLLQFFPAILPGQAVTQDLKGEIRQKEEVFS